MALDRPEMALDTTIAGTQTNPPTRKDGATMDEHRMTDTGDVLPQVEGPDGRPLDDGAVATGYPTPSNARSDKERSRYRASVEAERDKYERDGNAAGVAACDAEIARL